MSSSSSKNSSSSQWSLSEWEQSALSSSFCLLHSAGIKANHRNHWVRTGPTITDGGTFHSRILKHHRQTHFHFAWQPLVVTIPPIGASPSAPPPLFFYLPSSLAFFILPSYPVLHFSPSVSVCCLQTFFPPSLICHINLCNIVTASKQFNWLQREWVSSGINYGMGKRLSKLKWTCSCHKWITLNLTETKCWIVDVFKNRCPSSGSPHNVHVHNNKIMTHNSRSLVGWRLADGYCSPH